MTNRTMQVIDITTNRGNPLFCGDRALVLKELDDRISRLESRSYSLSDIGDNTDKLHRDLLRLNFFKEVYDTIADHTRISGALEAFTRTHGGFTAKVRNITIIEE